MLLLIAGLLVGLSVLWVSIGGLLCLARDCGGAVTSRGLAGECLVHAASSSELLS